MGRHATVWGVTSVQDVLAETGAVVLTATVAPMTTLRVGGSATVVECASAESLVAAVRALDTAGIELVLLAGGSNVLITDGEIPQVVVRIASRGITMGEGWVRAEAGEPWDTVVAATVDAGLGGLECLSGIPGSAGATPIQNVGAYGVEVASLLRRVRLWDRSTGVARWVEPAELGFGYRASVLKRSDRAVVLEVEFAVNPDGRSAPLRYRELVSALGVAEGQSRPAEQVRAAVLKLRAGKGMVVDPDDHDTWSAGSFFTNPVVAQEDSDHVLANIRDRVGDAPIPTYPAPNGVKLSAGWLIERAGFGKGFPSAAAPARLSTKHTLALTNRGHATAADIADLARTVQAGVRDRFGIRLVPEPVTIGIDL